MKLGILALATDRGLGIQMWEAARHLDVARTLIVDMGELARGFPTHAERFPNPTVVGYDRGEIPEAATREWLDGLDVVLAAETLLDWRVAAWAADQHVATVVQLNPEFLWAPGARGAEPTRWWAPTSWRLPHLPEGARVVPVPVADDRFPFTRPARAEGGPLRVLHVAGRRAAADRNGTNILFAALARVRTHVEITITTQDPVLNAPRRTGIPVEIRVGGTPNYWDLYADQDLLVMPRRYGGLCLPAQEAMAAGLAVAMSDGEPQRTTWPIIPLRATTTPARFNSAAGRIPLITTRPEAISTAINALAKDGDALEAAQTAALAWADEHRWSKLRPIYDAELADACS